MTVIENKQFDEERALYNLKDAEVKNCVFAGPADGESEFKEARNVEISDCNFKLRYPLWHVKGFKMSDSNMADTARAAIWYAADGVITGSTLGGIKAVRECSNIEMQNCRIDSQEFGWHSMNISLKDSQINSEYVFMNSDNVVLENVKMTGKYSFQYTNDLRIENSELDTKDAFWHSKNAVVKDSVIKGEYLGWYSEGLTLINCRIIGTQPMCYCKDLRLINCTMEDCDLAFEYSDVTAEVKGHIDSVKNPRSGKITADSIGEIIRENAVVKCNAEIICNEKDTLLKAV